jgi:hypothetical protein
MRRGEVFVTFSFSGRCDTRKPEPNLHARADRLGLRLRLRFPGRISAIEIDNALPRRFRYGFAIYLFIYLFNSVSSYVDKKNGFAMTRQKKWIYVRP